MKLETIMLKLTLEDDNTIKNTLENMNLLKKALCSIIDMQLKNPETFAELAKYLVCEKKAKVLKLRYQAGCSWSAIGEALELHEKQCQKIRRKAIEEMCEIKYAEAMFTIQEIETQLRAEETPYHKITESWIMTVINGHDVDW